MDNLTLLGEITDDEKAQLIDETFVNITLSKSEALGIAQLEFMYRGVPVISSGVGGQSWLVRNGVNGVVLKGPGDIEGASSAIKLLLASPKLRKSLSKDALRTSSQATLSNLIAGLSKKLMMKLSREPGTTLLQEAREKLIEARVQGSKKVAVTTKRLIMSSVKGGKSIVSVPYGEITSIDRLARRLWSILIIGLGLSSACFITEVLAPAQFATLVGLTRFIPVIGASDMLAIVLRVDLVFIPFLAAAVVFLTTVKDGYVVHYGRTQKVFLEREFGRVLRIADSLTEKRLFPMATEELETT
jgi:hypothetical protein